MALWESLRKTKHSELKQHVTNWTDKTYEVVGIDRSGINGQTTYKLEGLNQTFSRNELLVVEWI